METIRKSCREEEEEEEEGGGGEEGWDRNKANNVGMVRRGEAV